MMARWRGLCLACAVVVYGAGAAPAADFWIEDARIGCKIWSDETPAENEAVTWSGACRDGRGYDRLKATFENGEPQGQAIFVGANGDYYEGMFEAGERSGHGVYSGADGSLFEGSFVDGKPDGRGYSLAADGEEYLSGFKAGERHGAGILIESDGTVYYGRFEKGLATGFGRNGAPEGKVLVTRAKGRRAVESWKNGKKIK